MSKKDLTSNERFDSAIMSRVMARLSGCRAGRPPRPSPAALLRTRHSHTLRQHDFPQDAACPLAGKGYACSGRQRRWGRPARSMAARARRAVAVLLLAVAGLLAAPLPAQAQTEVPADWSLTSDGLVAGDKFRLLFATSTKRNASSTDIADYNTFVQNRAAAGHADIQSYSSGFRVVGSTSATDARDNTSTAYTSTNKGVRIYWLNGNKVADEYEDFYDGTWDEESNPTNESGSFRLLSAQVNYPFTGSNDNGTTLGIGRNATRHYRIRTLFQRGEVGSNPFARGISAPSPPVEARTGEPVGFDLPRVGVSDGDGREGVDDAVVFTVWLDRAASKTVRVFYQTFDITATAGADYVARSGAVEFAPGETQQTVAVAILDDDEDNGEFFRLALSLPAVGAGARRGRATHWRTPTPDGRSRCGWTSRTTPARPRPGPARPRRRRCR